MKAVGGKNNSSYNINRSFCLHYTEMIEKKQENDPDRKKHVHYSGNTDDQLLMLNGIIKCL